MDDVKKIYKKIYFSNNVFNKGQQLSLAFNLIFKYSTMTLALNWY